MVVRNEIARIEESIQFQNERNQQLNRDLEEASNNWYKIRADIDSDQRKLGELKHELTQTEPQQNQIREVEEASVNLLAETEQAMQSTLYAYSFCTHRRNRLLQFLWTLLSYQATGLREECFFYLYLSINSSRVFALDSTITLVAYQSPKGGKDESDPMRQPRRQTHFTLADCLCLPAIGEIDCQLSWVDNAYIDDLANELG